MASSPSFPKRASLVAVLTGLIAACSSSSMSGGGGAVTVSGKVTTTAGLPLAGATITDSAGGKTGTANADGTFSIPASVRATSDGQRRAVLRFELAGYAPQIGAVPVKPGQTAYRLDVKVPSLTSAPVTANVATVVNTTVMGTPVTISFGPQPLAGLQLQFAAIDPVESPGLLRDADATSGQALQSGGMFYVQLVDAAGNPVAPPADFQVVFGAFVPASVAGAEAMQGYNLNEEGIWDGALPAGDPASGLQWQPPFTGWINADRNFTTACVKGTVTTAAGTCKGGRVKATGPVGTASFDSSGSDGAFCVTGAQGAASQVTVGVSTTTVTMPATPGDCANPASCLDVGPLVASAAEDCAETEPPPPPPTCPGGCPVGATCLNGECVTPISCAGRCCPGQNDACMLPGASCFCDDYCITAGDCCPDFVASCQ